ncbi:DUF3597 domain-containing protein [Acetobacter orleanensis]|uniref:DUF3597 domain-containing protein n=1 Tax=Acetobacter orleanensis TaxID=104099 RepID=A0A4Y3TJ81_9PROT|nr:DUF3597 domain-containing protein [Acetobacter orleanensis]KXV62846.1 hypothetical protein AD949_08800 [Acetobacter orleanensis]PCD80623.1 DUF3597 domain-containing protein [Acetobacter orleanensis]GAN68045.1 hypothetical protein Abol_014_096 [Acetobacter orleanensis JCM 7639]GBR27237.1 hypothetical protein AA0473_1377 [Acetobacter orleanensis NRIC 0473]GEB82032.1 hypothetical protein AOR01nite_05090 [Acetobacter orleanensis]
MSIFGTILSTIFHHANAATPSAAPADAPATQAAAPATPADAAAAAPAAPVDIDAVLAGMAAQNGQNLNWKESIVDLLKLLGLDSSLDARKKLAAELGYTGSTDDSAAMNIWLIKEVRAKLAANGGKVPAGL